MDSLGDRKGVDLAAVGSVSRTWRKDAEFASPDITVDGKSPGVLASLDGMKLNFVAVCSAGGVEDSAGHHTELAVVGVDAEAKEVVFSDVDAGGGVDEDLDGSLQGELGFASFEMTVAVLADDAMGRGGFEPAAGFEFDDLCLEWLLTAVAVLVVGADLADLGDGRRRRIVGSRRAFRSEALAAFVDHRGDDAFVNASVFEIDQRIGVSGVLARLRGDGLKDQIVAQAGANHSDD